MVNAGPKVGLSVMSMPVVRTEVVPLVLGTVTSA